MLRLGNMNFHLYFLGVMYRVMWGMLPCHLLPLIVRNLEVEDLGMVLGLTDGMIDGLRLRKWKVDLVLLAGAWGERKMVIVQMLRRARRRLQCLFLGGIVDIGVAGLVGCESAGGDGSVIPTYSVSLFLPLYSIFAC